MLKNRIEKKLSPFKLIFCVCEKVSTFIAFHYLFKQILYWDMIDIKTKSYIFNGYNLIR